jgi:hypothetical protein
LVHRKGEHVGGLVDVTVNPVQLLDSLRVDQRDRQVAVVDARALECRERGGPELGRRVDELELDQVCCRLA